MRVFLHLLFLFGIFFTLPIAASMTLKEKFQTGSPGDYTVTLQNKTYSLLILREINGSKVQFEEISVPAHRIKLQKFSWRTWLENNAPHHSSWIQFELDLNKEKITESFSITRNAWTTLSDSFLTQLLSLKLSPLAHSDRKKIGPPPPFGENDHRKEWLPPQYIEGKRVKNAQFSVFQARWPKDESELSNCLIDLYFDTNQTSFPFPFWIQLSDGKGTYKIRVIDSGKELQSPQLEMPRRPLVFLSPSKRGLHSTQLLLKSPSYYDQFELFLLDLSQNPRRTIAVPFSLTRNGEQIILEVKNAALDHQLTKGHRYIWLVSPKESTSQFAESPDAFVW